jgi:hypothetical protein
MTTAQLRRAADRYQAAQARADAALKVRDALIEDALLAGWKLRDIADATGVTVGRIGQLNTAMNRRGHSLDSK